MIYNYTSNSLEDTLKLAKNIARYAFANMVVCLNGELGCGKTSFVKGFADEINIKQNITSPTFTIVKEYYDAKIPLFHIDAYRFEDAGENIGVEDYFNNNGIAIIEWSNIIQDLLPENRLEISFEIENNNKRNVILKSYGNDYDNILKKIFGD